MPSLIVPPLEDEPWPTLGGLVADWMEAHLVYGPGDLAGEPYVVDPLFRAWLYRCYEVYPRGHELEGRRRFKRVVLSERKGLAKTEKMALVAITESHPEAPVRCCGWTKGARGEGWVPDGRGIHRDAYLPLVAYTEEQTEELAYGAVRAILMDCPLGSEYDIGLDRVIHVASRSKIAPLAGSPNARDGARTTWQGFDEHHRLNLPRLVKAHQTMQANLPKRRAADAWSLEMGTAFQPGEGSIAEAAHAYAEMIQEGKARDPRMFYFHRQSRRLQDIVEERTGDPLAPVEPEDVRVAVEEATGPTALPWTDVASLVAMWEDPTTDPDYFKRVWLNIIDPSSGSAFSLERWDQLQLPLGSSTAPVAGAQGVLTFDGSKTRDSSVLTFTTLEENHVHMLKAWERPDMADHIRWEVPVHEVDDMVEWAMETFDIQLMMVDPFYWEQSLANWQGKYGANKVKPFQMRHTHGMFGRACRQLAEALRAGDLHHDGDPVLRRHIGNAYKLTTNLVDEDGQPLWVIQKDPRNPRRKIDGCVTVAMGQYARAEVIASGTEEDSFAIVLGGRR